MTRLLPALLVVLAAVCFGTTGTAQAFGPDASPFSIGAARILVGGAGLALVAWVWGMLRSRSAAPVAGEAAGAVAFESAPRQPRGGRWRVPLIVLVGALGVVGYQPAFFLGTAENGVAVGTVVALGSAPVITGGIDWLLRRRFPGVLWGVATPIAVVGVALLAAGGGGAGAMSPLGLAGSVGAGLSYAVYTLASKALIDRGWSPTGAMSGVFGIAAVLSLPVLLSTDVRWLGTGDGILMTLWLGLVTTTLAYVLFAAGLAKLSAPTVSTLTLVEPLTATVLGLALLHESITGVSLGGLVVLGAGIVVLCLPPGSRERGGARQDAGVNSATTRGATGADRVLVIGEALVDVIDDDGRIERSPGGSPANVALGLARLGIPVDLLTRISDDADGRLVRDHLEASGVRILGGDAPGRTATATAHIQPDGAAAYVFDIDWSVPIVDVTAYRWVHAGSIALALLPGADAVAQLLADAARAGVPVSIDPNIRPALVPADRLPAVLAVTVAADVVKLSDEDAGVLWPGTPLASVADALLAAGARLVVITAGAEGVTLAAAATRVHVPAPAVTVVDTVGAGDTVMTSLIAQLVVDPTAGALAAAANSDAADAFDGALLAEIGRRAAAAAAITVSRRGADLPTAAELA